MTENYRNRVEAGQVLARELSKKQYGIVEGEEGKEKTENIVVLALPRGGVPVAYQIAARLGAPLDVFLVRKIGVEGQEEFAMGAITETATVLNRTMIYQLNIKDESIHRKKELQRRNEKYRKGKSSVDVRSRTVILVDDGIATGATMRAAYASIKKLEPKRIIIAVPVGAPDTIKEMSKEVDEVICPLQPVHLSSIGFWYNDFTQTEDSEVIELLERAERAHPVPTLPDNETSRNLPDKQLSSSLIPNNFHVYPEITSEIVGDEKRNKHSDNNSNNASHILNNSHVYPEIVGDEKTNKNGDYNSNGVQVVTDSNNNSTFAFNHYSNVPTVSATTSLTHPVSEILMNRSTTAGSEIPSGPPNRQNVSLPQLSSQTTSSSKSEPALSWQIPPSALAPKKLKNEKIEKMELRIAENKFDVEAWLTLFGEVLTKADVDKVGETFERFLKIYPASSRQWIQYAEFELKHNNVEKVEEIFKRCLRPVLSVDLWRHYLNYVRRKNAGDKPNTPISPAARKIIESAYEFVLNHVGMDMAAGNLWGDYLFFLKNTETTSLWEEQQKMDQMRKTFKRATSIPIHNVEHIWKEYDAFENGLNKITAKKFLQERSPSYMTARTALKELRGFMDEISRTVIPVPPKWDRAELQQLDVWKRWIAWEKSNPLAFEDKAQLAQRAVYAYKQAMMYMRHYPEIWYEASNYWIEISKEEDAANLLKTAMDIMPTSFLVHFAYAELQERRKKLPEAHQAYETLLNNLTEQIKKIEQIAKDEIDGLARPTVEGSEEGTSSSPAILDVWVMLMRYYRRAEGVKAARSIFSKARKSPYCTYHIYVAAALMEYHCSKDQSVAGKIFELGLKSFGDKPEYVVQYLDFLIELNDDNNTRALFERTLLTMPVDKAKIVWEKFSDYENNYGDIGSLRKIEERRAEKYSDESPLIRFAERYSYLDTNVILDQEIGATKRRIDIPESSPPAEPSTRVSKTQEQQDSHTARKALLNSVQPEKYPRPDFRQWVSYKPTPDQLRRPTFTSGSAAQGSVPPPDTGSQPLGFQNVQGTRDSSVLLRPSPPPLRASTPPSQHPSHVIWKRGPNGMLLPEAIANFLGALPPPMSFPGPYINPIELAEVVRTVNITTPNIASGSNLQPPHTHLPPPGQRDLRGGSPSRGGSSYGVDGRYVDGGPRGGYNGQENVRGGYGIGGGPGAGRARQGEFFGKQMRVLGGGRGSAGGKRRRREYDGEEDFQGKGGPGINRPPEFDLYRVRQQKRARE
ncbi:2693_t:CDS:10, partial [Ambispora gerdemannii]